MIISNLDSELKKHLHQLPKPVRLRTEQEILSKLKSQQRTLQLKRDKKWNKFQLPPKKKKRPSTFIKRKLRQTTVADFVTSALEKFKNVTDNRIYRKKHRKIYLNNKNEECPSQPTPDSCLTPQDNSLLEILKELQKDDSKFPVIAPEQQETSTNTPQDSSIEDTAEEDDGKYVKTLDNGRLRGYFCSDTVFNLSHKILSPTEISVLEKGLGFSPTPFNINEHKLRQDFNSFCRRMRLKWHFRNEVTENFSEVPAFRPKSNWNPPKGSAALELFLGRLEQKLFELLPGKSYNLNLDKEEWFAMKNLAADRSIVIKPADKGSCVVVWDRQDYLAEAHRQLDDNTTYQTFVNSEGFSSKLSQQSNSLFKKLADNKSITDKELKYFTYTYHKAANLGKLYLLPKIHKRLQDVPGRPIISNCGAPTEKASEFLDYHLKPLMQAGKSYIRDSGHFLSRLKDLGDIPEGAILVTADVVGLYPSIPHIDGLEALRVKLNTREEQKVPTVDLVNMAEFVLKNNVFEFGEVCKKQVSGTAMGTKFAPPVSQR